MGVLRVGIWDGWHGMAWGGMGWVKWNEVGLRALAVCISGHDGGVMGWMIWEAWFWV